MYLKNYPTEDLLQLSKEKGLLDATLNEIMEILKTRRYDL